MPSLTPNAYVYQAAGNDFDFKLDAARGLSLTQSQVLLSGAGAGDELEATDNSFQGVRANLAR